jgi:hypothetical protein
MGSVVIGDNRAAWNGATWLQVGVLALLSAATGVAHIGVVRAGLPRPAAADSGASIDWLVDLVLLARQEIRRLGPGRRPALALLVGATNADASLGQLVELLLLSAGMIFAVVLSAESIVGRHSAAARKIRPLG